MYEFSDGHVLFMASEQAFWKNSCIGVGREDLFERYPGSKYADHARDNLELQAILRDIFRTRTSAEWLAFAGEHSEAVLRRVLGYDDDKIASLRAGGATS